MAKKKKSEPKVATCRLYVDVEYDPDATDPESLATAMDLLVETAMSTPGILDEYGDVSVDGFYVLEEGGETGAR